MSGELNDNSTFRKRRPIPIPLYDDRYIERPYLKKHELAKIRDNLDELVEIKTGSVDKETETMTDNKKDNFFLNPSDTNTIVNKQSKQEIETKVEPKLSESKIVESKAVESKISETKVNEPKHETKTDEIKLGIANLAYNKEIKKIDIDNKKIDAKLNDNKPKINKRKVIKRMNDEEYNYNISPEERRRMRKSEYEEYANDKEANEAIKKAALLSEQNKRELEELRKSLATENFEIRKELKNEFGTKFNELGGRFNEITGKFDKVSGKLEETCTGIECLKKDLANMNKNFELTECPECGAKVVPPLASFCPSCSAKIHGWEDDDGKPVKGWKPNWEK